MLSIYLCEDDKMQLENWEDILKKYLVINDIKVHSFYKFSSPKELMEEIGKNPPSMGLYYLDVEFHNEIDGFTLAEQIRERDPRSYLVFVTVHSELSQFPYENQLEAMDYIVKENTENFRKRLTCCLQKAMLNYCKVSSYNYFPGQLVLKIDRELETIPYEEIILIETETLNHKVHIHLKNGYVSTRGSIKGFMQQLDSNIFCQVSQSSIVNISWVDRVDQDKMQLCMKNKMRVNYSYRYKRMLFFLLERYNK